MGQGARLKKDRGRGLQNQEVTHGEKNADEPQYSDEI